MGALDPTASNIGHGQLGLRSGLRVFNSSTGLTSESASQKHAFVEIRAASIKSSGWSVDAGSVYKLTIDEVWNYRRLDVVSVLRSTEVLTRVDQRTDVAAGKYFYDSTATVATPLYVQLSDSSNPNSDTLSVVFGFYFGSVSVVQPCLGSDKFIDGGLEIWTDPTTLTNWTFLSGVATSPSINKDSTTILDGSFSARLQGTIAPKGYLITRPNVDIATVPGAMYRLSGQYRTNKNNPSGITPGLTVFDVTNTLYVLSDGRSTQAGSYQNMLQASPNETQRFCFDFIAPGALLRPFFGIHCGQAGTLTAGSATGYCEMWVDGLKLQRIYRFEQYEQRLTMASLPQISAGRKTIFFDRWFTGTGTLTLANGEAGSLESLFGKYEVANNDCIIRVGGRFSEGGNEIPIEDMLISRNISREVQVEDSQSLVVMDNNLAMWKQSLPSRSFNTTDIPGLEARDVSRPRTQIFGRSYGFRPPLVSISGTTGYGTYECIDPLYLTDDTTVMNPPFRMSISEEAANKDTPESIYITHDSLGGPSNALTVGGDWRPITILKSVNDTLSFNVGGAELKAVVALGTRAVNEALTGIVTSAANAMTAVSVSITGSYSDTTHKVTFSTAAGVFQLLLGTGTAKERSLWRSLGFTGNADLTGALTYTGDSAIFSDAVSQHILRCDAHGYRDTTTGTYTGSGGDPIRRSGDIIYYLLNKVFGVPFSMIDTSALAAVRASDTICYVTIGMRNEQVGGGTQEFGEIVEWLENSSGIDVVFTGDKFTFAVRDNSVPSGILDLYDRDFSDFDGYYSNDDLAGVVLVKYEDETGTGIQKVLQNTSAVGVVRAGAKTPVTKTFVTYCASATVTARKTSFVTNTSNVRRRFRFTVKGACMGKLPMDKVRINRSQYLGRATDANNRVVVRILNKTDNWATFESVIEAAEVLTGVSGAF